MSDYGDGDFMDMVLPWALPPSPTPNLGETFAMLDQTDNGLNPISDAFLRTNKSEQKLGLVNRVAARIGRTIPPITIEKNKDPFLLFKSPKTDRIVIEISPGLSPSVLLESPSQHISPLSFLDDWPPEIVENSGDDHAATMIFDNNVPYQPTQFDLPPQEGSDADSSAYIPSHESQVDPIGGPLVASFDFEEFDDIDFDEFFMYLFDDESENQDEEKSSKDEDTNEEGNNDISDELEVKPSSPKRRKYEVSDMFTARRTSKDERSILRLETEEDQPEDGYRWRKYGQKVVKGNPNPRGYYKCSYNGCDVKKHVERAADDVKILVVTYDGMHEHPKPTERSSSSSGPKNRRRSSVPARLGRQAVSSVSATQEMRPFPYSSASATQDMRPFPSSLNPGADMTHLYMTGLSKMPSLPVNQNHGIMGQNAEPKKTDHVIPDGTELYKEIMERLMANYGVKR